MATSSTVIRIRSLAERARSSLFFIPGLSILVAAALARVAVWIDSSFDLTDLPLLFTTTVASSRAILATAAGATITVAGIVFSVTLVSLQLAASQYSPRVVRGFLRDRFQQVVIGIVVGAFTYDLLVLAVTRSRVSSEGPIESVSSTLAIILAVVAILAIVAFIDHSTRAMQVGHIIRRVADETLQRVVALHPAETATGEHIDADWDAPAAGPAPIRTDAGGWVQQVDWDLLLGGLPPKSVLRLDAAVGDFVAAGGRLGSLWGADDDRLEAATRHIRRSIGMGWARTMQQDASFGLRQLVDIALRALSPGINDPTTAVDVIVHLEAPLREILTRDIPSRVRIGPDGQRVYLPTQFDRRDYVYLAMREIRRAGGDNPSIVRAVLRLLHNLIVDLEEHNLAARADVLRTEAKLTVSVLGDALSTDPHLADIREMAERFGFEVPEDV